MLLNLKLKRDYFMSKKYRILFFMLILLIGLMLRIYSLDKPNLYFDESVYAIFVGDIVVFTWFFSNSTILEN